MLMTIIKKVQNVRRTIRTIKMSEEGNPSDAGGGVVSIKIFNMNF